MNATEGRRLLLIAGVVGLLPMALLAVAVFARGYAPSNLEGPYLMVLTVLSMQFFVAVYLNELPNQMYSLPFTGATIMLALYHHLLIAFPTLPQPPACTHGAPCTVPSFAFLGFVTAPLLSAIAAAAVVALVFMAHRGRAAAAAAA